MKTKALSLLLVLLLLLGNGFAYEISTVKAPTFIPIYVSVTGDVPRPGVYTLTNVYRVSDALYFAEEDLTLHPDITKAEVFGKRNIMLIRDGKRQSYDLLKFFRMGEIEQNPFLKDGDIIVVNAVAQSVTVQGGVNKPGDYEFRNGDTVKDLLDLALGVKEQADMSALRLYRYQDNNRDFDILPLDGKGYPEPVAALQQKVQPGDRLLVPINAEFRKLMKAAADGFVKLPGSFFIGEKTTLYDLLVMCGGPTAQGNLQKAYVFNRPKSDEADPDFQRLRVMPFANMTFMEYDYMRTKTRQLKGKYPVDVQKVWDSQGKDGNIVLQDGDELYVPDRVDKVWVTGQVKRPGLINWETGKIWSDYIDAAGGLANNRNYEGIRIIKAASGNWVKARKNVIIQPGDIIFVPQKDERFFYDYFKDAVLLTTQVFTIIIYLNSLNLLK